MPSKKSATSVIPAQKHIDNYLAEYAIRWEAHMQNGGRSETKAQAKAERHLLHKELADKYPVLRDCLLAYQRWLSKAPRDEKGRAKTIKPDGGIERIGWEIYRRAGAAAGSISRRKPIVRKNKGGRPSKATLERAKERYLACIEQAGWVPFDAAAAALIGCATSTVAGMRNGAEWQYEFIEAPLENGWVCGYDVKPVPPPAPTPEPPSLVERIKEKLARLPKEDLAAIDELLQDTVD